MVLLTACSTSAGSVVIENQENGHQQYEMPQIDERISESTGTTNNASDQEEQNPNAQQEFRHHSREPTVKLSGRDGKIEAVSESESKVEGEYSTSSEFPMEREVDYDEDVTDLYKAIELKDWEAVLNVLEGSEGAIEAATWVFRNETSTRSDLRWRILPIHAAIIFKAPDEVIEALLQAHPASAGSVDDQGMIPLHLAFRHGTSDAILYHLLRIHPEGIHAKDNKGRIPLQMQKAVSMKESAYPGKGSEKDPLTVSPRSNTRPTGFATYVALAVEDERNRLVQEYQTRDSEQQLKFQTHESDLIQTHKVREMELQQKAEHGVAEIRRKVEEEMILIRQKAEGDVAEIQRKAEEGINAERQRAEEAEMKLEASDAELGSVRAASQSLMEQFDAKCTELDQCQRQLDVMGKSSDVESAHLKGQLGALEDMNEDLRRTVKDQEKHITSLSSQVAEMRGLTAVMETETGRLQSFKDKAKKLEEANESFEKKAATYQAKINEKDSQLKLAKAASEKLLHEIKLKKKREEELSSLLDDAKEKLKKNQSWLDQYIPECEEKLRKASTGSEVQIRKMRSENEDKVRKLIADYEMKIRQMKYDYDEQAKRMKNESEDLLRKIKSQAEDEMKQVKSTNEDEVKQAKMVTEEQMKKIALASEEKVKRVKTECEGKIRRMKALCDEQIAKVKSDGEKKLWKFKSDTESKLMKFRMDSEEKFNRQRREDTETHRKYKAQSEAALMVSGSEMDKMKRELNSVKEKYSNLLENHKTMEEKSRKVSGGLALEKANNEDLKDSLAAKEVEIAHLKEKKQQLEELVKKHVDREHQLGVDQARTKADMEKMRGTLNAKDAQHVELKEKSNLVQHVLEKLREELQKAEERNASYRQEVGSKTEELERIKIQHGTLKAVVNEMTEKNKALEEVNGELYSKTQALSSKLMMMSQEQEKVIRTALKQENDLRASMEMKSNMMEHFAKELKASQANVDAERDRLFRAKQNIKGELDTLLGNKSVPLSVPLSGGSVLEPSGLGLGKDSTIGLGLGKDSTVGLGLGKNASFDIGLTSFGKDSSVGGVGMGKDSSVDDILSKYGRFLNGSGSSVAAASDIYCSDHRRSTFHL